MAQTGVITGQYVCIQQTTASIGDRIFAQMIDWGVMLGYLVFSIWFLDTISDYINTYIDIWYLCVIILPIVFYTPSMEVFNHGQTVGKMLLRIRVMSIDGSTPTLGASIMRWSLYIIDGPLFGGIGVLSIILSKNNQRLGDLAAGTVVIKLQNYHRIQISLDEFKHLTQGYRPRYPQASDLSLEQIEIITRTVSTPRRDSEDRIGLLSQKVQQKLNVKRREQTDMSFLQRILRDYQYYALEEI